MGQPEEGVTRTCNYIINGWYVYVCRMTPYFLGSSKIGALQVSNHGSGTLGCVPVNVSAPIVRQTGTCEHCGLVHVGPAHSETSYDSEVPEDLGPSWIAPTLGSRLSSGGACWTPNCFGREQLQGAEPKEGIESDDERCRAAARPVCAQSRLEHRAVEKEAGVLCAELSRSLGREVRHHLLYETVPRHAEIIRQDLDMETCRASSQEPKREAGGRGCCQASGTAYC